MPQDVRDGGEDRALELIGNLGFSGSNIDSYVRARLYWNPKIPELPAGHQALANEIYALLDDSRLSASQQAQLEGEYFPHRPHL